ncbi:MAG: zf-HC2 domain-containing protein [Bacteroidales bacterium]|nr:zf-HC2 domain-containing protein [Bacteroidales bacterium]
MKNCHQFEELISGYVEGELDHKSNLLMEQHVRECQACSRKVKNVEALCNNLRELPELSVSPDFENILRARISIENKQRRRLSESLFFPWQVRVPVYGISFALILLAFALVFPRVSNQKSSVPQAATDLQWKGGQVVQQNAASGSITVYPALDREPAINIISQHPSKFLSRNSEPTIASADSTNLLAQNENLDELVYQTSY